MTMMTSRQEFWTYSIITCCGYPLDLIDSIQLIGTKDGISAQTGNGFDATTELVHSYLIVPQMNSSAIQ